MPKIEFKRGTKDKLPTLAVGEPGFTTDTKEFFIGSDEGNIEFAKQSDLDSTNENVSNKAEQTALDATNATVQSHTDTLNNLPIVNANAEVLEARGTFPLLGDRLDDVNEQLADIAADVKSFGAKGDGVTNDSAAFQAANDYLVSKGGGKLYIPAGTYIANFIVDSYVYVVGSGTKSTIIKSAPNSNKDVIQGRNFLTLTGTVKQTPELRGVRYAGIRDVMIDGNKANNTAGYGIRIWGCSWVWDNVLVQNCVNDGIYTEYTTIDAPTGQSDPSIQSLEGIYNNIKTINNGGNGWAYKGPHDSSLINFNTYGNGGYGLYQVSGSLTGFLWNSWLNGNSFYIGDSLECYRMQATGPYTGTGIEIAPTAGNVILSGVYVAGHQTGAILRGTNVRLDGNFIDNHDVNNTTGDAIIIDGVVTCKISITGSSNNNVIKINNWSGRNILEGNVSIPTGKTLYNGTFGSSASINLVGAGSPDQIVFQIPTRTLSVAGYNPILPQSNGNILTDTSSATTSTKGPVYQQPAPANLSAAPTASDFNNLIQLLKYSQVLA